MIIYKVRILSNDLDAFLNVCSDGRLPVLTIAASTAGTLYIVTEDDYPIGVLKADFQLAEFTRTVHSELQRNVLQTNRELDRVRSLEDANEGLRRACDRADDDARQHDADEKAMLSAVEYHKRESEDRLEDLLRMTKERDDTRKYLKEMTEERDKRNADALAYLEERKAIEAEYDALMIKFMHLEQEIEELKVNEGAQLVAEPAYVIFDVEGVIRTHHKFKSKEAFYEFILRRSYAWRDNGLFTRGPNIEARLVLPSPAEIDKFVPVED